MQFYFIFVYTSLYQKHTLQLDTPSAIFGKMLKRPREKGGEGRSQAIQTKYKIQQKQEMKIQNTNHKSQNIQNTVKARKAYEVNSLSFIKNVCPKNNIIQMIKKK